MPRQNYSKIESIPEEHLKKIKSLTADGYSAKYIFEWLEDVGITIALATVKNWHKKYLESIANTDDKAKKALNAIEKAERDTTPNPLIDDPKDLDDIAKSWGIPDDISKTLDMSPEVIIGASQKMIADLYLSCGKLAKNRMNLHEKGLAKYPVEQLKTLKLLHEMYEPLMGIKEYVSPNAAIKSLELYGYDVSKIQLLKDVSAED